MEIEGAAVMPGEGKDLVALMSFAVVRGFGAQHPLIALADRLHAAHGVRMGPLTTFYDGSVEDEEDAEKLELAWQPAGPLRDALARIVGALETDALAASLAGRAGALGLAGQAAALLGPLEGAEERGTRVRLVYTL
jgi:hypothetical protein